MGKAALYLSMAAAAVFLVYEMFFKKKDRPVGAALGAASSLSVAGVEEKAEAIREELKRKRKGKGFGFLRLPVILSGVGSVVVGIWYFFFRKDEKPDSLYQLGFLGMPAPAGMETDRRYLAGVMKKQREDRLYDLASTAGARTLGGLPIKGLTAQFGKVYHNENYQQNSQWKSKF